MYACERRVTWVNIGAIGFEWVCMGALRRCRVHGRTHKHCKRVKMVILTLIWTRWSGIFARTSCFGRVDKNGHKCVQMCRCVQCTDACKWVQQGIYMTMASVKNKSKRDMNSREEHFSMYDQGLRCVKRTTIIMMSGGDRFDQERGHKGCVGQDSYTNITKNKKTNMEVKEQGKTST